jgi:Flp pilus assembly protein CpaB
MRYAVCSAALLLAVGPAFAQAEKRPSVETVSVLVARKDIPLGTPVNDPGKLFKVVRYVKGDEPGEAITKLEQLKGKRTLRALAEDQPVKTKDVGDVGEFPLPKGLQAITVKVLSAHAPEVFILPGSRVDVANTVRMRPDKTRTETVLRNVLVLAVEELADGDRTHMAVTLAVKLDDAKKLRQAEGDGELSLGLSSPEDREIESIKEKAPSRKVPDVTRPVRGPDRK